MKNRILSFLLIIVLIGSCQSNQDEIIINDISQSANKILTLGDSRVEGNTPNHESYRYEFWKKMVSSGIEFDLLGPLEDDTTYPNFLNKSFDDDHAGVGGDTTVDIINRFNDALLTGIPDIVLLGIGGNDITSGRSIDQVIANIDQILTLIQEANPNAVVFVEIIAGANPNSGLGQSLNGLISDFQTKIELVALERTTDNFKVITVDMNTNFTNNANYYADTVHYSVLGSIEIANRYFNAITPYLQ